MIAASHRSPTGAGATDPGRETTVRSGDATPHHRHAGGGRHPRRAATGRTGKRSSVRATGTKPSNVALAETCVSPGLRRDHGSWLTSVVPYPRDGASATPLNLLISSPSRPHMLPRSRPTRGRRELGVRGWGQRLPSRPVPH